jgi:hypothetical protein
MLKVYDANAENSQNVSRHKRSGISFHIMRSDLSIWNKKKKHNNIWIFNQVNVNIYYT